MKKHLLKLTLLVVVFLSATTFNAQALWTTEGTYKISTSGLSPNLYLTINGGTGALEWAEEITTGDNSAQVWFVGSHRTPAGAGFIEITSNAGGIDWTLCTAGVEADHPNYTLTVEMRTPKVVAYTPEEGENAAVYSGDLSGLDQFQRRKTKVGADGLADATGSNPADGNNALFIKTPWGGNSRYGIVPTASGESVQFDGAGIDVIQYHLVEAAVANVNSFGIDAFSITNPVNNQLTIKGATSKVSEISIFSVLGNKVMSKSLKNLNGEVSLNVSDLSSGLYIIEMTGFEGQRFTKKIIKQ
ncbi:T9SS type A sorting domain-containing protein [uncultured Polaribacter sp.]|uniref:T9SS type A sorting domain-containing protein n=1 Tax=uncultured Polaribacter sp. TaxID=174711 RepID=UPI0026069BDE|nr:T9SS type A sorting domain-containing protein [uncultured Polaribacter sp.]